MVECVLIVVSYRSAEDVSALLATVPVAAGEMSWHVVVVNNDPTDDLEFVAKHPQASVVEAGANLGYAGGINLGIASAPPSRWLAFLNPDLRLSAGSLAVMAAEAGDERAVVPRIIDEAGSVQPSLRREPSLLGSLGDAVFGNRWSSRPRALSEMVRTRGAYRTPRNVDWATGAILLVPTAIVQHVGSWDSDRFFLYSEETDYCRRLRASGVEVRFAPAAAVSHRGGGSGTSDALHALLEVNRVRYYRKWHGPVPAAMFAAVAVLNNLLRCHRSRSRAALRALFSPRVRAALPGGERRTVRNERSHDALKPTRRDESQ